MEQACVFVVQVLLVTYAISLHPSDLQSQGSVALVAQQAFIINGTVRSNILFGKEYNEEMYSKVVKACALGPDFEVLHDGDKSVIGEKVGRTCSSMCILDYYL